MTKTKKRIIVKISGASLKTDETNIIDIKQINRIITQIKELTKEYAVGIVLGGGNIWRGNIAKEIGMDRAEADYMGMLATITNSIAVKNCMQNIGMKAKVFSALECDKLVDPYIRRNVLEALDDDYICIFAGGTGYPYFTTDTAAAIRAAEIGADLILMGKNGVDGVYSADPNKNKDAVFYDQLSYLDVISKNLQVMDSTALTLCENNNIKILVFNIEGNNNIIKAMDKKIRTTTISK